MGKNTFDTGNLFVGGSGLFMEYHDIIKPTYLSMVYSLVMGERNIGVPINILKGFTKLSLIEWYLNRSHKNPFKSLDYASKLSNELCDELLLKELNLDKSVYDLSAIMNGSVLLNTYKSSGMTCPVYIYTNEYEKHVEDMCNTGIMGVAAKYVYGDLEECTKGCNNNYTYILSDIELLKKLYDIMKHNYIHIVLASDFMYNYNRQTMQFKYDLQSMMVDGRPIRIGAMQMVNIDNIIKSFTVSKSGGIN